MVIIYRWNKLKGNVSEMTPNSLLDWNHGSIIFSVKNEVPGALIMDVGIVSKLEIENKSPRVRKWKEMINLVKSGKEHKKVGTY